MVEITNLSTEELRELKKAISEELSRRHKAKEDEKCSCWTCSHCFYDENAHPTWRNHKGGYRCLKYGKKGKIIDTKHKAPSWCPIKSVKEELEKEAEFHCGFEESGGHAYNCNDCPNKCEEWYQWDKEMKEDKDERR